RLDQRRPLRGVGRLVVPVADTPLQAGGRLPEAGQVLFDELELFGQRVGTHGGLSPSSRGPASRGGGGNRSCAAVGYSPGMRSAAICLAEPPVSMTAAASSSRTPGAYRVGFPQTGQMSPEAASQPDSSQTTPTRVTPSRTSSVSMADMLPAHRQSGGPTAASSPAAASSRT